MRTPRLGLRVAAAALLVLAPVTLSGCRGGWFQGGGQNGGGPMAPGSSPVGQRSAWGGGGSTGGVNTPVLGATGDNGQPPPDLTGKAMPAAPQSFDADTDAVLRRYNTTVGGVWATPDNVQIVVQALQLYPALRQHPLYVNIGPDGNRPGLSGLWVSQGNRATVYLYEPKTRSTPPHELAHDQTLLVQQNEGSALRRLMDRYWDSGNAFARQYSRSNDREFAADALSYWARRASGLDPSVTYSPPAEIVSAVQPMLVEAIRNR